MKYNTIINKFIHHYLNESAFILYILHLIEITLVYVIIAEQTKYCFTILTTKTIFWSYWIRKTNRSGHFHLTAVDYTLIVLVYMLENVNFHIPFKVILYNIDTCCSGFQTVCKISKGSPGKARLGNTTFSVSV